MNTNINENDMDLVIRKEDVRMEVEIFNVRDHIVTREIILTSEIEMRVIIPLLESGMVRLARRCFDDAKKVFVLETDPATKIAITELETCLLDAEARVKENGMWYMLDRDHPWTKKYERLMFYWKRPLPYEFNT
jgi:hypothetical protein